MNALVVEDDDFKLRAILECLLIAHPELEVITAKSFSVAAKLVKARCFDLLILDMSLPMYDHGDTDVQGLGGRRIVRIAEEYGNASPTILVTQYATYADPDEKTMTVAELAEQLGSELGLFFLGAVAFDRAGEGWREQFKALVRRAATL